MARRAEVYTSSKAGRELGMYLHEFIKPHAEKILKKAVSLANESRNTGEIADSIELTEGRVDFYVGSGHKAFPSFEFGHSTKSGSFVEGKHVLSRAIGKI